MPSPQRSSEHETAGQGGFADGEDEPLKGAEARPATADPRSQTDQGSQFTSFAFTNTLKGANIRISMDGRGRWMDNVFIERLWRSLKYECVFLNAFETGGEAKIGIECWLGYYNADRPHSIFRRPTRSMLRKQVSRCGDRTQIDLAAILSRNTRPPLSGAAHRKAAGSASILYFFAARQFIQAHARLSKT